MESSLDDIQPVDSKDYKTENILKDDYKVFFTSCEDMSEIPDNTVHLHFFSPPYLTMRGTVGFDSYIDYLNHMYTVLKEMYRTISPGRPIMIQCSDYQISSELDEEIVKGTDLNLGDRYDIPSHLSYLMHKVNKNYAEHYELIYEDTIIWSKPGTTSNRAGSYIDSCVPTKFRPNQTTERISVFRKGEYNHKREWKRLRRNNRFPDYDLTTYEKFEESMKEHPDNPNPEQMRPYFNTLWEINAETQSKHPAPFPVRLPEIAIQLYTLPNDIVCDAYMGSGTTAVAAQKTGRKCVGYDNLEAESDDTGSFKEMIESRIGAKESNLDEFL